MIKLANYIGGEHTPPENGKYLPSPNPATGEAHVEVPLSAKADVERAVQAAKKAFKGWSELRVEERAAWLDKVADEIDRRKEELALAESKDQGKPITLAQTMDIPRASYNFRFFAGIIRQELSVSATLDSKTFSYVRREPIGVVGLISPWNLPLYLLTWKLAPAIAYGNTCVAKPSELTSYTAHLLGEILTSVGFPKGVINIVLGLGADAGQALVEHPDVKVISFTGGTVTGRKINQTAAGMLKKVSLELGGKNPTIVFGDADVKKHLKMMVRSAFLNQGEICLCGSRLYVEKSIFNEFVEAFVKETRELKVGDPLERHTFMGALVSSEHREKVESYVKLAESEGLQILTGGKRPQLGKASDGRDLSKGFFFEPTVLVAKSGSAVLPTARIQQEEVFGPVVTIAPFQSDDEVVELANSTKYGLSASVYTTSLARAHTVSARLHAGTVWVNCWMTRDLRMPFGGVKESGVGREGQLDSIHVFTEAKTVTVRFDA